MTYEEMMANGGVPAGPTASQYSIDPAQLLKDRPDVLAEYNQENTRDDKSKQNLAHIGVNSPEDFAQWWYNNGGQAEGYSQTPAATTTPATTPTPTTPATDTGPPSGLSPNAATGRDAALAQALNRAKMDAYSRGLNWDDYAADFTPYYQSIYNSIDPNDKNPGSYFDPNMSSALFSGAEAKTRNNLLDVASHIGGQHVNTHMLDDTINRLLTTGAQGTQDQLMRAQKRGQINDIGYGAGMSKLESAKAKAKAKLSTTANDILNNYQSQYDSVANDAQGYAQNYHLGQIVDFNPYNSKTQSITDRMNSAASGELESDFNPTEFFNFGDVRQAAGQSQGAVNLHDLDVLDALSKRKKANEVGNGLGSQGAF